MATSPDILSFAPDAEPAAPLHAANPVVRIGALRLEPATLELTHGDRVDVLRPLPASLLFHLLKNRHRIVPKDELHRVLWPDTSVSDAALASAVRDLRRILDDDGEAQEIVRTFRGRGYRLVAPVQFCSGARPVAGDARHESERPARELAFVGRVRELARFERHRTAAGDGQGGALLVESVAGGGRSTFLAQCARRAGDALWLGIRCDDEPWIPRYDAIGRILLALESAVGSDPFEDWLRHEPDLGHLMPGVLARDSVGEPRIEVLSAALRRLIDRAHAVGPVVIAIDDVHSIDRASLDLLCTGAARGALLIGTVDPTLVHGATRAGLDALFSERSRIRLRGLSAEDIDVLARDLPQARRDPRWSARLRERTDGHPADVVAVIRQLEDTDDGSERTTSLLPPAVFERMARRIDALTRPARAILTACAALPPRAELARIRLLSECPADAERDGDPVAECVEAGLMRVCAEPTRLELCGQFVRHVALARLSSERRRELERRATVVLRLAD